MKLYYFPGACSLAAHIVMREAGIEPQLIRVDLATHTTADGADFNTINPRGYVPVLELPSGEQLSESAAILQYLADVAPQAALAPASPGMERYRLQEWLSYCASELLKTIGPLFNPALHEGTRHGLVQRLTARLVWADAQLRHRDFVLGDRFSVADAYLFAVLGMLRIVGLKLADWPALAVHSARVASRPAVQAALRAEGLV
ncbi:glutathione transferase GstA [Piscinibacter sp. XHJ-5]|uniref:glutathione transferase GstA n=1 Tax=Piscinibacter sp. XHJ-5 TaxID=3037797 RepID=UPI002452BEA0|nr:glutathione transferase GstA [Piscinibacter sp. XHJ-5]